jgi:glc operon protein GlcG
MSSNIAETAVEATLTLNPLDFIPDEIPFDLPYGLPVSLEQAQAVIQAAVAEAKKRNWKMNVAVADSGGNLVAFQRMDGAMLASIQIAEHKARAAVTFRRRNEGLRGWCSAYASQLSAGFRWSHCVSRRYSADRPGRDYRRDR